MESITCPSPCSPDFAEGVCGLPWHRLFKIRNAVAWRWYYKFGQKIPFEEFASMGNLVIAECVVKYQSTGVGSFAHFLYKSLSMRMPDVARREWAGTIAYTYDGTGRHAKRTATVYRGPACIPLPHDAALDDDGAALAPVDPALTRPATQDAMRYLHECLDFVATRATEKERVYFWHSLDGDDFAEIGRHYGIRKSGVRNRVDALREKLTTWADEVSYAAAD